LNDLIALALLLGVGRLLGEIVELLGFPSLLGEIFGGFLVLQIFTDITIHSFDVLADIGVILMLLMVGFDFDIKGLKNVKAGLLLAGLGFFTGLGASYFLLTNFLSFTASQALFYGLIFAGSSTPIGIRALAVVGKLNSRVGKFLVTTEIIEDFYNFIALAIIVGIFTQTSSNGFGGEFFTIASVFLKILVFFVLFVAMEKLIPKLFSRYSSKIHVDEGVFTISFIFVLILAYLAETLGLASITGAFFAGIVLSYVNFGRESFIRKASSFTRGIFVPFFFIWLGAQLAIPPVFTLSMISIPLVLVLIKFAANIFGGLIGKLKLRDSITIAISMLPRSGEQLVIIIIAVQLGIFTPNILNTFVMPSIIIASMLTIVVTPIILKRWVGAKR